MGFSKRVKHHRYIFHVFYQVKQYTSTAMGAADIPDIGTQYAVKGYYFQFEWKVGGKGIS